MAEVHLKNFSFLFLGDQKAQERLMSHTILLLHEREGGTELEKKYTKTICKKKKKCISNLVWLYRARRTQFVGQSEVPQ